MAFCEVGSSVRAWNLLSASSTRLRASQACEGPHTRSLNSKMVHSSCIYIGVGIQEDNMSCGWAKSSQMHQEHLLAGPMANCVITSFL